LLAEVPGNAMERGQWCLLRIVLGELHLKG
jgi:hypothetical protein